MQSLVAELNQIEQDAQRALASQLHALLGATFKVAESAHALRAEPGVANGVALADIEDHAEALILKLHQLIANQQTPKVRAGSQLEYLAPDLVLPAVSLTPALQAA